MIVKENRDELGTIQRGLVTGSNEIPSVKLVVRVRAPKKDVVKHK